MLTFAPANQRKCIAQMAESVDALVSNTSGATRAGSTPALGTCMGRIRFSPFFIAPLHYVQNKLGRVSRRSQAEGR